MHIRGRKAGLFQWARETSTADGAESPVKYSFDKAEINSIDQKAGLTSSH
jgi:hypothetical protein